jgi:hypothetical protein
MSSVISLLNQIKNDEIVLPAIQRDFVWPEEKIVRLLDSMVRGYPIGLVLLWETYNDIQYRSFVKEFQPENVYNFRENDSHKRIKLVLDGQQRLQSLYMALYGSHKGKSLYFDVLSGTDADDLAEDRFLFYFLQSGQAAPGSATKKIASTYLMRVSDLFAMTALAKETLKQKLGSELNLANEDKVRLAVNISRFDDAFLKDENILKVATIDENLPDASRSRKSEADVLEIFVRINREGTQLSRSDLVFSLLKLNWRESAEALPEFVRTVNVGNSFELDTDFVIRCLFAVSDLGTRVDLDVLRKRTNVDALRQNFAGCCDAIAATVDFVISACWCQSSQLLGGSSTLVPLVYYLFRSKNHQVRNDQTENVRQSLLLFALARPFSRYSDSRLGAYIRSDLKPAFEAGDGDFPYDKARLWVKHWERLHGIAELMDSNQLLTLHLVQGLTGSKVQYAKNAPEVDHIFPRAELRAKGFEEDEINDVANFWILAQHKNRNKSNQHPKQYFSDVSDKVLQSALIDRSLLDYRQYRNFLTRRKEAMVLRLSRKLGWSEDPLAQTTTTEKATG